MIRKTLVKGVNFLKKSKVVFDKNEIESILPHRGRMLLLDRVEITKKMLIGEFLVTPEVCEGHVIAEKRGLTGGRLFRDGGSASGCLVKSTNG